MKTIRVMRNPIRSSDQPWLVFCGLCKGHTEDSFLGSLMAGPLGWARSWRIAQDWAQRHAIEHEKTRCTTCLHLPAQALPTAATKGSR